jgi:hypothetical protein
MFDFTLFIFLNLYAGLLFGWFYWRYGLWAAMVGHSLFHLIWYPLDRAAYRRLVAAG